jgi:GR25 family glycosyltransferase involved in LPS biosynthesis
MNLEVFVLHHRDFRNRGEKIFERLDEERVTYQIVDGYSPEEIDYEKYTKDYKNLEDIIVYQLGPLSYRNTSRKISPVDLSLILKHHHSWEYQYKNSIDYALILEDDCEIPQNFSNLVDRIIKEAEVLKLDLVMIGSYPSPLFIAPNQDPNFIVHYHPLQKTRCTHGYLISKSASKIMVDGFTNINNAIDFKMNEVIQLNNLRVGWLEPGLPQIEKRGVG